MAFTCKFTTMECCLGRGKQ